jgi:hypothetical protein
MDGGLTRYDSQRGPIKTRGTSGALVIVSLAGVLVVGGCSRREQAAPIANPSVSTPAAAPEGIPAAERPPDALVQIGELAEDIFDAARTSKWSNIPGAVQSLKESSSVLSSPRLKPDLTAQLRSRISDLERSAKARRRVQSMDFANSITRLVAELSAPYQTEIPYKIVLLDYYGRQLQLGLAASRPSTLKQATADLRQTWNSVEPSILRRGYVDDARRFTDIVVQLEGARHPTDFVAPVRAELAAVDRLEKIFKP